MNDTAMMERISKYLKDDESITVNVAHSGAWNGANVYLVTRKGFDFIRHEWESHGTLRAAYRRYVMDRR